MKSLVASALVISALALPPATVLAQSSTDQNAEQSEGQTEGMTDQNATESGDAAMENGNAATDNAVTEGTATEDAATEDKAMSEEETDKMEAIETAGSRGDFLTEQTSAQTLSENYIGASVLIGSGEERESVGTISQLIFDDNDAITGAVVDVGGFLGLGAKPVGLQWNALEQVRAEETVAFTTSLTREELENAPEFETLDEQAAEQPATEQEGVTTN